MYQMFMSFYILPECDPELRCEEDHSTGCHTLQTFWVPSRNVGGVEMTDQQIPDQGNSTDLCSFCSSVCHWSQNLVRKSCKNKNIMKLVGLYQVTRNCFRWQGSLNTFSLIWTEWYLVRAAMRSLFFKHSARFTTTDSSVKSTSIT